MSTPTQPVPVCSMAGPSALDRILCKGGDLTLEAVDAIVNAANERLAGGGGVDGAIHRAAGPGLMEETRQRYPQGCPTGQACITGGHGLPARHVIHTVGPIWSGGAQGEAELLASCFTRSLRLAVENEIETIAFPAISAGVYGYPMAGVAQVALQAIRAVLEREPSLREVRLVLFAEEALEVFERELERLRQE